MSTWRVFTCVDCPEDNQFVAILKMRDGAPYDAGCEIEFCPRCDSHRSIVGYGDVTVTPEP